MNSLRKTAGCNVSRVRKRSETGFSLIEMLTVMAVVAIMGTLTAPALQALVGAGTINRAATDFEGTLKLARTYAMAHGTYVRVILSQQPDASGRSTPKIIVLAICPASGGLDQSDTASMGDPVKWPAITQPLILDNLVIRQSINATLPDTSQDADPFQSGIVSEASSVKRTVGGFATQPVFTSCIQLNPAGQAQVISGTPARYIKTCFDRPAAQAGRNPFLIRISGINGDIGVFRKGSGLP